MSYVRYVSLYKIEALSMRACLIAETFCRNAKTKQTPDLAASIAARILGVMSRLLTLVAGNLGAKLAFL